MLDKLRLFLTILDEGSIRRAAERCHIAQSAVTRQIQLLEHDLGGKVLERTSAGVRATSGGHALAERARKLLAEYDSTMAEARRLVRGESDRLRIGYMASAVQEYLAPALTMLRQTHPNLKVKMLDQTPAEMISALGRGEIDLALTFGGAEALSREYYIKKLASVPSVAVLPFDHPLASQKQISISQLKDESFVTAPEAIAPGRRQEIIALCRRFGKFRPRFVAIGQASDLAEGLAAVANQGAVSLSPSFISHLVVPNVVMVPIAQKEATCDVFVAWQRGKTAGPLRALLDLLQAKSNAQKVSEALIPEPREQLPVK